MNLPDFFKRNKSARNDQLKTMPLDQDTQETLSNTTFFTCRETILHACSTNDIPLLRTLFQGLQIIAPHPEIKYPAGSQPSDPPCTYEMLVAAVREQHDETVEYLFNVFPNAEISPGVSDAALSCRSIPIWTRLLTHDRLFLNNEIDESGRTPFSMAC